MADLGIARMSNEAGLGGTLTRADLADVVHNRLGLVPRRIGPARRARAAPHVPCAFRRTECEDFRLRQLHPARQGRARRPQPEDGRRGRDRAAPGDDLPRQPDHARQDREISDGMATGEKAPGAFKTIGELSSELGVAQHILRYWETKFPQLRPLQRAGNRRYYRPGRRRAGADHPPPAQQRGLYRPRRPEGASEQGRIAATSPSRQWPVAEPAAGDFGAASRASTSSG